VVFGRKLNLISTFGVKIKILGAFQNKPENQNKITKKREIVRETNFRKNRIGFYCH